MTGPRIFDISPMGMGGNWLAALMRKNNIVTVGNQNGRIALRLEWALRHNIHPELQPLAARFFTGLEAQPSPHSMPILAWRHFAYLRQHYGQAVFLLVIRDADEWIAHKLSAARGLPARLQAIARDLTETELADTWRQEYLDHIAQARRFFAGDSRFIELDFNDLTFETLRDRLAPWHKLTADIEPECEWPPHGVAQSNNPEPQLPLPALMPHQPNQHADTHAFATAMADFCLGAREPADTGLPWVSDSYAYYDGQHTVFDKKNQVLPILRQNDGKNSPFFSAPWADHCTRTIGVLNEVMRLGRSLPLHMDMQDSRRFTDKPPGMIGVPILTYNRMRAAKNVVLWPLVGYHSLGAPKFAHATSPDPVPWSEKLDRLVWRGDLSGQLITESGELGPSAFRLLQKFDDMAPDDEAAAEAVIDQLHKVPRLMAVRKLTGADYDLKITLSKFLQDYAAMPFLLPHLGDYMPQGWFYRYRYILSLPGYDTGSNFIMAANSGSVVFKADEPWELFYSHLFRPWEHYIPVATDSSDIPEKLDWARNHPQECRNMIAAANAACARLADPALRAGALNLILDGLEA